MTIKKKKFSIGVDIGGTNMKAVLFDGEKVILDYNLATPKDNLEHFLIMIQALVSPLLEKATEEKIKIEGIGIGAAGVVNPKQKKIIKCSPNLVLLDNVFLGEKIEEKFNYPVWMDNDASCFLLAEARLGAGVGFSNLYGITFGTGIGGAWIMDNKIYHGSHFGAGEPGRFLIDIQEMADLEKLYQKLMQNNPANMAVEAYRGDNLAERSFQELGRYLGIFITNLINLLDPEIIIFGGGAARSHDLFMPEAKKIIQEYVMNPESKKIKISKGKLDEFAGAIGAALLVE